MTSLVDDIRAWRPTARHILLILLSILLIATAVRSLEWRAELDVPWMLFDARMMDQHGLLPYRDLFDVNMVGTFYLHILIGRLTGYSDGLALRWFDLAYLAAILAITWGWLKQIDRTAAWAAAILFGLAYLSFGPFWTILEREYLMLLPLSAAVWLATALPRMDDRARCGLIGLLFGLIATVKPHAAIGFAAIAVFLWFDIRARRGALDRGEITRLIGLTIAGGAIPAAALAVYLVATGTLGPYLDILTNYVTLYSRFTTDLRIVTGAERTNYVIDSLLGLGRQQLWLAPAAVGLILAFTVGGIEGRHRRIVLLTLALAGSYVAYLLIAGQFHPNHWLLMLYFLVALASLCFLPVRDAAAGRFLRLLPTGVLVLTLFLKRDVTASLVTEWVDRYVNGKMPPAPSDGRADAMAEYLRANQRPGDSVQPLDWANGVMHAMLLTNTPPANRFTVDMLFLHDTTTPYIQGLQREFIDDITARPPRFMIYFPGYRFTGSLDYVQHSFPALQAVLDERYWLAFAGRGYRVYQHGSPDKNGLILYPINWPAKVNGYLENPPRGVLGIKEDQLGDVAQQLEQFTADRQQFTVQYLQSESDARPIETWLNAHAYRYADTVINEYRVLSFLGSGVCAETTPLDAVFGGTLRLDAGAAEAARLDDGQTVLCVRMEWTAEKPAAKSYQAGVYLIDADGKVVAQHDGLPLNGDTRTDAWTPGQMVTDRVAMALPDDLPAGVYTVVVTLYDPDTGERLKLADGADSVKIGGVTLPVP